MPDPMPRELEVCGALRVETPGGDLWLGSYLDNLAINLSGWGMLWRLWRLRPLRKAPWQTLGQPLNFSCLVAIAGRIILETRMREGRLHRKLTLGRFFSRERIRPEV